MAIEKEFSLSIYYPFFIRIEGVDRKNESNENAFRCGENNALVASERTNADYTGNDLRRIAMSKGSLHTVTCPRWFLSNRPAAHRACPENVQRIRET